jgi:transcriptional regulator with XRE-family HTH domain
MSETKVLEVVKPGWKIKTYRREMGMTQMQLCKECGIIQSKWSFMESGKTPELAKELLPKVRNIFEAWREDRIFELEQEINRLKMI